MNRKLEKSHTQSKYADFSSFVFNGILRQLFILKPSLKWAINVRIHNSRHCVRRLTHRKYHEKTQFIIRFLHESTGKWDINVRIHNCRDYARRLRHRKYNEKTQFFIRFLDESRLKVRGNIDEAPEFWSRKDLLCGRRCHQISRRPVDYFAAMVINLELCDLLTCVMREGTDPVAESVYILS